MAAISGVDPWPLSLRELLAAAEAKKKYDWDHTANMMALFARANWKGKFTADDFHPMIESAGREAYAVDPGEEYKRLKAMGL